MLRIFFKARQPSLRGSEATEAKQGEAEASLVIHTRIHFCALWIATPTSRLAMTIKKWILGKQAKRSFFRKTRSAGSRVFLTKHKGGRIFDEKTSEAVQGVAAAGFFSKALFYERGRSDFTRRK